MVTSDWEILGKMKVDRKIIMDVERDDKFNITMKIGKWRIVFDDDSGCICNWAGSLVKRKNTQYLVSGKKYDLGYIGNMELKYGRDWVKKHGDKYSLVKKSKSDGYDNPTDNVFTLSWKGGKLIFFNGNNNGFYNSDLLIYENDTLVFKNTF